MPWCTPKSLSMFSCSTCLCGFTCSVLGCQGQAGGPLTALPLLNHAKVEPPLHWSAVHKHSHMLTSR